MRPAEGEATLDATVNPRLDREFDRLESLRANGGDLVLAGPQGLGWDPVYVFGMDTPDRTVSEVVGGKVHWQTRDPTRSAAELMVFVSEGKAVGAYEVAVGFAPTDYQGPLHRELRLRPVTAVDAAVRVVGQ
ncbi:hypothetical protein [Kitasatospora sp. NPDC050543]|uniref:hypothetical protein n=1 Tax=Kitasatospora sp. NPDC050543 TaxID=3364054 RepID=UPI00379BAD52